MNRFSYLVIFAIALFVPNYTNAAKITDIVLEYINPKYIEAKLLEVKVNQNNQLGNTIDMATRVIKDFPQDTKAVVKLYSLNAENKKVKLLYSARIPLCKENESYDKLPSFFKLIQSSSRCIKKGQYQIRNIRDFNYANLVPDLDKKGQNFKFEFTVVSFWAGRLLKGYNTIVATSGQDDPANHQAQPEGLPGQYSTRSHYPQNQYNKQ